MSSQSVELSVVIPAYNEEFRLPPTLIDILDFLARRGTGFEVIVVDDGSSDGTSEVTRKFQKLSAHVRLISLKKNSGKGAAVRAGMLEAVGSRILFADADGSTPIKELDRLEDAISRGSDVAIGSRAMSSQDTVVRTRWYRRCIGRVFNFLVTYIARLHFADTQCGFKLFTKDAAKFLFLNQKADGYSFDVEVLLIAKRAKMKVAEIPVNWTNVPGSKVNLVVDSFRMLIDVIKFRITHRGITGESFGNPALRQGRHN